MGIYLNPSYEKFFEAINSEIYVDKTGLISYTNSKSIQCAVFEYAGFLERIIRCVRNAGISYNTSFARIKKVFPNGVDPQETKLSIAMAYAYETERVPFVAIIDD